jgi:hypothetical protein
MKYTVFYSWQSDLPNSTNRGFIQDALEKAAGTVAQDDTVNVEPVIDRDTAGVAGSPEISQTIFSKIEQSQALVVDVSIINPGADGRPTPNPNALLELGFGAKALGWERIVMVFNTAFGRIEDLPFDLRMRRVLPYEAREGEQDRSAAKKGLTKAFEGALRAMISSSPMLSAAADSVELSPPSLADQAIAAIEADTKNQSILTRRYLGSLIDELVSAAPDWSSGEHRDDVLIASLERSQSIAAEFGRVVTAIADMDAHDPAQAVIRIFERILERYDLPRNFAGGFNSTDFDYYKFIGHELFVMFVAALLGAERWELLASLLDERFQPDNARVDRGKPPATFAALSEPLELLDYRKQRLQLNRVSIHADLLNERHQDGAPVSIVSAQAFMEADAFLFLRGEVITDSDDVWMEWVPWSSLYLRDIPRFLWRLQRKTEAVKILPALGTSDVTRARNRIALRAPLLNKLFTRSFPRNNPLASFDAASIATL